MSSPLFVGIDAGGTKTALLATQGKPPVRLTGPGAQVLRDGPEAAVATLTSLIKEAQDAFDGAALGGVAVGLAGAGRAEQRDAVTQALKTQLDGAPVVVTHDADVALEAAYHSEGGALVVVGTGSMVYARTDEGETLRAGGWGALLGDDGSGTALGRATLRAVLASYDGGPPSTLAEGVAKRFGLDSAEAIISAVYLDGLPLSDVAPVLLDAVEDDDWVASSILTRETNALGQQVGWLATRAGDTVPKQLAYTGGLTNETAYRASLTAALERHLPGWTLRASQEEPVEGALAMAKRLARA
ncbi:MAG: BadF/BadG/BcrA/BcrD ATPase family protein [Bacteroidota bacterium]